MSGHQSRIKKTGRGETGSFASIPHAVLNTRKYAALSGWAVRLLVDIAAQYTGRNNGDMTASWAVMNTKGWRSKGTLHGAVEELLKARFIMRTRQGGRHVCTLYAITWHAIDECLDRRTRASKIDTAPTNVAPGGWRDEHDEAE